VREELAKLRARFEQLRLGSAGGDSQLLRDFLVRVALDVVQHEHGSGARRQLGRGLLDRLGDEGAIGVGLDLGAVLLDLGLEARQPATFPQRVERTVYGDAVRPSPELRIAPVAGQRSEDLNPDLLGDVRGQVGVTPHQSADDHVEVRGVPGPKGPERPLISIERASNDEELVIHV
jgi:hypothetical protein